MLQEIRVESVEDRFKRGKPLKTLQLEYNTFSISGTPGSEIRVKLEDLQGGRFRLLIDQIGVPQLSTTEFFLDHPAITFENGLMKLRDELENIATFTPITD